MQYAMDSIQCRSAAEGLNGFQGHSPFLLDPKGGQEKSSISVFWARHQDEVRAAQRLRFEIFSGE